MIFQSHGSHRAYPNVMQNGCADSILSSMEDAWIADYGRDWLHDADRARTRMISEVEPKDLQLVWFDGQMFWQITGSIVIFYCTIGGAFILSCELFSRRRKQC